MSIFDTLQMAPLSISAKRSMWTDGSVGQWTIPVWSGTETSIQFLLIKLLQQSFQMNQAPMNPARHSRNRRHSLSSIGWRRGPGRGGTYGEDAPFHLCLFESILGEVNSRRLRQ